jgi:3-hydroxybutyryl-CoA dehydratase
LPTAPHELCPLEHEDVLRYGVERHIKGTCELGNARLASGQPLEDRAARRIGESRERVIQVGLRHRRCQYSTHWLNIDHPRLIVKARRRAPRASGEKLRPPQDRSSVAAPAPRASTRTSTSKHAKGMKPAMTSTTTYFDDLKVGQEASMSKTVTEGDIARFAEVSGDKNPVHLDSDYAATTIFKERIAHGMLSAAYISAVFGMKLPGPGAIYISQSLNFKAPVKIGDTVITTVKVLELIPEKKRAKFETVCAVNGKPVLHGEAQLMIPARPA